MRTRDKNMNENVDVNEVVENNTASINLLQKKFSCGFSRIQAIIIKLGAEGEVK